MKQMKAKYLHPEMRYARTALLRNLRDRYDKPKFMEKYGMLIVNLAVIVIILVFMWLIIDKIVSVSGSVKEMINTNAETMKTARDVIQSLDHICTGSGLKAGT